MSRPICRASSCDNYADGPTAYRTLGQGPFCCIACIEGYLPEHVCNCEQSTLEQDSIDPEDMCGQCAVGQFIPRLEQLPTMTRKTKP